MPSTDIAVRWRVRPGRECRVCGWALLADMQRGSRYPDGHATQCRACQRARHRASRDDINTLRRARYWADRPDALSRRRTYDTDGARRAAKRARDRAYYEANRESKLAYQRDYRETHLGAIRERARHRYRANGDSIRAARRSRSAAEREAETTRVRRVRAALSARTPEQVAADRARLRPDELKRCRKCRVRLPFDAFTVNSGNADGLSYACRSCSHPRLLRIAAPRWSTDDEYACVYCGAAFKHTDHVWPSADGGPDDPRNLVPACEACNTSKRDAHVLDFVARRLGPDVVDAVLSWPVRYVDLAEELS